MSYQPNLLNNLLKKEETYEEKVLKGKSLRKEYKRTTLGDFKVEKNRSTAIDILNEQNKQRVEELLPIRHARMSESPFAFFRGGAAIMAHDLSKCNSVPIVVQLCGDMHVSNFGFFSTSEKRLVFGVNDFDETYVGNFDWDLKRLVASVAIAGDYLGQNKSFIEDAVRNVCWGYKKFTKEYSEMPYVELARKFIDSDSILENSKVISQKTYDFMLGQINKAKENNNIKAAQKFVHLVNGHQRIKDNPPFIIHREDKFYKPIVDRVIEQSLESYANSLLKDREYILSRYRFIDAARKIVGIGSVGTICWILYFEGNGEEDPLFLQFKEAKKSVLEPYFKSINHVLFKNEGERVVHGQRLIQGAPDIFLGSGSNESADFYFRQLRDMKGGMSFGEGGFDAEGLSNYARLAGHALALAHCKSADPAILFGYCGLGDKLDNAMINFALNYNEQNKSDYKIFLKAIKEGKLPCAKSGY